MALYSQVVKFMLSEFFRKLREKKKQEKAALKAAQENPEGEPE